MKTSKFAAATLALACVVAPVAAIADTTWDGTAKYSSSIPLVGPFNTYDFSSGGVLLIDPINGKEANGYYQSFVATHLLNGAEAPSAALNSSYEITIAANFKSVLDLAVGKTQSFTVQSGGTFALYLDTTFSSTGPNPTKHNFSSDTGFMDGTVIMSGNILGGDGTTTTKGTTQSGYADLELQVTYADPSIYSSTPFAIGGGESSFLLRLNHAIDTAFINSISKVQSVTYDGTTGDLKYAADGYLVLTPVPEPGSYAMLLAGLGLLGTIARRRSARAD